ncbi:hypothetical protein M440DRAFT_275719 [Trichoderma longibrachiatum ATCC 18648]|uniref:Uncharacterized protein n=1 Tax=Trichoderma longibrachiatum ATCC 18648 TaxID=983965 RepID=A0A2T4C6S1_TRILO|nr:hypothetical protein M440DRAFT_275719 [Trichoderma longibrachiatum ATCC 18648]
MPWVTTYHSNPTYMYGSTPRVALTTLSCISSKGAYSCLTLVLFPKLFSCFTLAFLESYLGPLLSVQKDFLVASSLLRLSIFYFPLHILSTRF